MKYISFIAISLLLITQNIFISCSQIKSNTMKITKQQHINQFNPALLPQTMNLFASKGIPLKKFLAYPPYKKITLILKIYKTGFYNALPEKEIKLIQRLHKERIWINQQDVILMAHKKALTATNRPALPIKHNTLIAPHQLAVQAEPDTIPVISSADWLDISQLLHSDNN